VKCAVGLVDMIRTGQERDALLRGAYRAGNLDHALL
jgi:hypothetical protein